MMRTHQFIAVAFILGSLLIGGCGKREGQLSGTVMYRGKPVESGEILFTADESRGHSSPGVMVEIKKGTFRTPPQRGHWGGPYVAIITAYNGQSTIFANYELPIDLPQGDASIDIVVPDSAGKAETGGKGL